MNNPYLFLDANVTKAEIAKLLEAYPELSEDDQLRMDAIEGETNAFGVIEKALAERQEAEAMAGAIKEREINLAARRSRFERKSDAMRGLIKAIMKAADLPKVQLTEASISITSPRVNVIITNEADLPQGYVRIKREADKAAIKSALMRGDEIPGAELQFGDESLTIRTK